MNASPKDLTDIALLIEVKRLAQCERETTATLVAHLVEVDRRDLYRAEGCSSMFSYCTEVLRLSEQATFLRLRAARAARQHPEILAELASGALSLSAIKLLEPHLTVGNAPELLEASRHKSKREVEKLVRSRDPLPDVPASVRKLPAKQPNRPKVCGELLAPRATELDVREAQQPSIVASLAPDRYKVQFTANETTHANLRRAQDLLRHRIPDGDLSQVFELALGALVEKLEKQRLAATERPRPNRGLKPGSRTIPAAVKRAVWKRDGGRCAFVGNGERRCTATAFLEFHHLVPFAQGGHATVENIALRCRAHNQYEALRDFGPGMVREPEAGWPGVVRKTEVEWPGRVLELEVCWAESLLPTNSETATVRSPEAHWTGA